MTAFTARHWLLHVFAVLCVGVNIAPQTTQRQRGFEKISE
jgi:hypothetical protein